MESSAALVRGEVGFLAGVLRVFGGVPRDLVADFFNVRPGDGVLSHAVVEDASGRVRECEG